MISERQIAANRRNAGHSTGPRSRAGRARSAQNAHKHGLAAAARHRPEFAPELEVLARALVAGHDDDPVLLALARNVAAAQIDTQRVRVTRAALVNDLEQAIADPPDAAARATDPIPELI